MGAVSRFRPPRQAVIYLLAFATVGGVAFAAAAGSTPARSGVLHGCVVKRGPDKGSLRIVKPAQRCRRGERRLTWNVGGAGGGAGPAGPTGTSGTQGTFSFDDFDGMPCDNGGPGSVDVTYDSRGYASLTC